MLEVAHHNCIQSCLNKSQQIVNPVSLTIINLAYRLTPKTDSFDENIISKKEANHRMMKLKIFLRNLPPKMFTMNGTSNRYVRRELTRPIFFYDHHNGIEESYKYYCADPVV